MAQVRQADLEKQSYADCQGLCDEIEAALRAYAERTKCLIPTVGHACFDVLETHHTRRSVSYAGFR
jgi:hypothetical protein